MGLQKIPQAFLQAQDIPKHQNTPPASDKPTVPSVEQGSVCIQCERLIGAFRSAERGEHKALRLERAW